MVFGGFEVLVQRRQEESGVFLGYGYITARAIYRSPANAAAIIANYPVKIAFYSFIYS